MPVRIVEGSPNIVFLMLRRGRDRPCLQRRVDIGRANWNGRQQCRRSRSAASCRVAAVDDQVDAVHQGLGEAGGYAGALLVAIVERRAGASAVGHEFVQSDRGIDQPAAGKPSFWSLPVTVRNAVRSGVV